MQRILITGGSGFIGSNLVRFFCDKNNEVLNYDIKKPIDNLHINKWVEGDVLDYNQLSSTIKKFNPDYIFHFAARTDLDENKDINGYSANIKGVENIVKVVNELKSVKRTIYASSRMVCSIDYTPKDYNDYCPPNLYGESKMIGEGIVKKNAVHDYIIVRPTSIWGPFFHVPYRTFFDTIKNGTFFLPKGHNPKKSFGFVGNSVYQLENLLFCSTQVLNKDKTYYLTDYPPLELKTWSDLITKKTNGRTTREIPVYILKSIAILGDILAKLGWKQVPLTTFRYNNMITNMVYDTSELEKICGKLPYNLENGVDITLKWINKKVQD
ncbi:NAD-dependent epimerase/dehydratase family protein [Flavobacterium sp. N2270]|uniref:NAD-dependent epimerase/dehydratase family protein n=1 Tax=Flavobacterium sp. N2270 TaxID=2986831 RepID=UPI002224FE61|nr:NAD(P)-dependent oxidoreductase [Flavobacterium sp. N2270]